MGNKKVVHFKDGYLTDSFYGIYNIVIQIKLFTNFDQDNSKFQRLDFVVLLL